MEIDFEKAKLSDCDEIHNVMHTSAQEISRKAYHNELAVAFDDFYADKTVGYVMATLKDPDNYTLVAKDKNRIIGFIQLKASRQHGTISHLYILPGYEGNSVGAQLFSLIREHAVQLDFAKLTVESTLNALNFYEKNGFANKGAISDGSAYNLELELYQ